MMRTRWMQSAVVVAAFAAAALAAFGGSFDALRAELLSRDVALAAATDKASRKQHAAVVKATAAIDAYVAAGIADTGTNVNAAVKIFPGLEKAFATEFPKGLAPTGTLGTEMASAAASLKSAVEADFNALQTAIGVIATPKPQKAAHKQANAAANALGKADLTPTPSKIVKLLKTASAAIARGNAIVAKAPVRNTVTATLGTTLFVGQNNYLDYTTSASLFSLSSNANTAAFGGFASFEFSPFIAQVTGTGDFPITGTMRIGVDPGNNTQYYISSGTMHLTTFDLATQRAAGSFTLTVMGHPEYSSVDGAFDFHSIRVQP